jgi:DNA-binding NarL/FixJ family response regulator
MINILLADDHRIIREGLKEVIANFSDMNVCCEAKNSPEVIKLIKEKEIDLIILDINMPGRNGFETLKDIKIIIPDVPVLILSVNPEELYARRCLRAGASGYMNKDIDISEFITAIRTIAGGQKYISPLLANQLYYEIESDRSIKLPQEILSKREYEVYILLAQNISVSEIAKKLDISIKTVSTLKSRILSKLNLTKKEDLLHYSQKISFT